MIRRRSQQPNGINRKTATRRALAPRSRTLPSQTQPNQIESTISWLKNADLGSFAGHLNAIAEHVDPEKMSSLTQVFKDLGGSNMLKDDNKINLLRILKDKNAANRVIEVLLEIFSARDLAEEEKGEEVK